MVVVAPFALARMTLHAMRGSEDPVASHVFTRELADLRRPSSPILSPAGKHA